MKEQTVFIIDDDLSAREGLTFLVQAAGLNVESFPSAKEFLDSGKVDGPGCIILDVRMPEMTGPELQEILTGAKYSMPIIFLSAHGDVPTTAKAMKKGAVDFLTKPVDKDNLLEAIQVSFVKDSENRNQLAESSTVKDLLETLSPREHQIMTYVITGMLNKQIAGELSIAEVTVKIHRGRIMKKLGVVSVVELVRLCEKVGITPGKTHYK
jgi:FixJ family two-component response regulator